MNRAHLLYLATVCKFQQEKNYYWFKCALTTDGEQTNTEISMSLQC